MRGQAETIGELMSLMRGIVENTIRNMSPEERREALLAVAGEVVISMSAEERIAALTEVVRLLTEELDSHQRKLAMEQAMTNADG